MQIIGLANSLENNFRYDVFKEETLGGQYKGISKLVRDRLNDP